MYRFQEAWCAAVAVSSRMNWIRGRCEFGFPNLRYIHCSMYTTRNVVRQHKMKLNYTLMLVLPAAVCKKPGEHNILKYRCSQYVAISDSICSASRADRYTSLGMQRLDTNVVFIDVFFINKSECKPRCSVTSAWNTCWRGVGHSYDDVVKTRKKML